MQPFSGSDTLTMEADFRRRANERRRLAARLAVEALHGLEAIGI